MQTSNASRASIRFDVGAIRHLVLAGWAGRNQAAVEAHIRELEALGTPRPSRTPVFYRVASSLLTTGDFIEVVGGETSGEVEFVLVTRDDGTWVGLGSDHTDRGLERSSVALSKQLCAKIVATDLWRVDDLTPHWDQVILRSWAHRNGKRELYQEGTFASLLPADRLTALYESFDGPLRAGSALFSGTIATVHEIAPADEFEMEMEDPVLQRTLRHRYRITALPGKLMTDALERATLRKVSVRLLPILFVLYIAAFLDRTNVSLAALQMNQSVGLSSAAYGFGAGVFFIGYGLFEVPSNLFLARVGARRWIARIAISWGILACAMMFVRGPMSFYILRFLLGAAEAGAFPGIVYYLSQWFPEQQRASAMSKFMMSIPLSSAIGGPVGGALLSLSGNLGLAGWQWLFIAEGIPSIILGVAVLFYLTDRPSEATWLADDERRWLMSKLDFERRRSEGVAETNPAKALTSGIVWWLAVLYFLAIAAELGPVFFGPVLVADALHLDAVHVGFIIGAIGLAGVAGMLLNGAHSDRKQERIAHAAWPMVLMAIGFVVTAMSRQGATVIVGLVIISFAVNAFLPVFWCVPSAILSGPAAAGGIALINSIGNLGGFAAPNIVGWGKTVTGNYVGSMMVLGVFAVTAAAMMLGVRRARALTPDASQTVSASSSN